MVGKRSQTGGVSILAAQPSLKKVASHKEMVADDLRKQGKKIVSANEVTEEVILGDLV